MDHIIFSLQMFQNTGKDRFDFLEPLAGFAYKYSDLHDIQCDHDRLYQVQQDPASFHPVGVERTSQLAMVQELVSLSHGVSMIPAMARVLDQSDRRVYRSFAGKKPVRKVGIIWNPYRFQSRLIKAFIDHLKSVQ